MLVSVLLALQVFMSAGRADDPWPEGAPPPAELTESAQALCRWAARTQRSLAGSLHEKIALLDATCGLNELQRHKLTVVGHGDNKRLAERIEGIVTRVVRARGNQEKIDSLTDEASQVNRFIRREWIDSNSLFAKLLEKQLSPEQSRAFQPYSAVLVGGGQVRCSADAGISVIISGDVAVPERVAASLSRLTQVRSLTLRGWRIDDSTLSALRELTSLQRIDLTRTSVTDDGLIHLQALTKLEVLRLGNTKVTDAGLLHLGGLKHLWDLYVGDTAVTDAGVATLKRRLPTLNVYRTPRLDAVDDVPVPGVTRGE